MFLTRFHASPSSSNSQRLTSFDGSDVGVCSISIGLRFCVEQGINGLTGVRPVPPSIRLSKLNIPDEGVFTLTPAMSATFLLAKKSEGLRFAGTLSDDGRLGR